MIDRLLERSGSQHSGAHAAASALPPPVPARGLGVGQIGAGVAAGVLVAAAAAWLLWPQAPHRFSNSGSKCGCPPRNSTAIWDPRSMSPPAGRTSRLSAAARASARCACGNSTSWTARSSRFATTTASPTIRSSRPTASGSVLSPPTEMRKVPAAGGTPLTITKVNRSRGASWGADGTIVLCPRPRQRPDARARRRRRAHAADDVERRREGGDPSLAPVPARRQGGAVHVAHADAGDFDNATIEVVDRGDRRRARSCRRARRSAATSRPGICSSSTRGRCLPCRSTSAASRPPAVRCRSCAR